MAGEPILVRDIELLDAPLDECKRIAMGQLHALGIAGRARGVDDVGQVHLDGTGVDAAHVARLTAEVGGGDLVGWIVWFAVHHEHVPQVGVDGQLVPVLRLLPLGDQHLDPAVADDESGTGHGSLGIDRDISGTGLHDPVEADDGVHRLVQEETHPVAGLHSLGDQSVGETVGPLVELSVRECPITVDDRGSIRELPC